MSQILLRSLFRCQESRKKKVESKKQKAEKLVGLNSTRMKKLHNIPSIAIALFAGLSLLCCESEEPFREVGIDNFWEVAEPDSQQMDAAALNELGSKVSAMEGVYSFLIIRNGKIVHEQYLNGANPRSLLHIRSITKRITATLTGIAIDQGHVDSVDIGIANFFPEITNSGAGQGWEGVSVYHLLNMVSGMDWVEETELNSYDNNRSDPLKFIFGKNITHIPGTYYSYNTPGTHLLSYIIERAYGGRVAPYAEVNLLYPLGIRGYRWEADGNGVKSGGAGLELTARDLAKIGLLYLQDGKWGEQQIVSEEWIHQCFDDVIALDNLEGDHLPGISIGQTWWTREINGVRVHYGDGYGGQILMLIPQHEIVIVMNRSYRIEGGKNAAAFESFFSQILPGVLESVL